ncbi:MAG: gliding motility-associated C-terminal domain-containing protein [Bacteroidetes bacterium]|nr:gliding motility-associated C-terminal domain-containing protein [Bacteroidota bacterium]
MKKLLITILALTCQFFPYFIQGQTLAGQNWYFGNLAGLNFATTPPTPLTNSAMNAFEGCATISDAGGNLQFYTNGNIVWDRNHLPMPSGNGLNGDGAATQTAIIVPRPQNPSQYYIFTVDTNGGARGLCYSEVDMSLNGGNGDVTTKNVQLVTPVAEKLTAVRHANGVDVWVIVHGWNNNEFNAYAVTPAGINNVPVVSSTGLVHGGLFSNAHGYMKASPDAQKIAVAIRGLRQAELFDLNNITGQISNPVTINFTPQIYGLEFSPDNRYLYVGTTTNPAEIFQYDITAGNPAAIVASGQSIGTIPVFMGALQLGIDGKIYVCQFQSTSLAVISQPNLPGAAAGFSANAIFLGGKTSQYGLPNFIQSFFIVADFTYTDTCSGQPTNFTTIFAGPDSVKWNFDDPASGALNSSNQLNPQHIFSSAGQYTVELIVWQGLLSDTVEKTIQILATPDPDLGNDISECLGNVVPLNPGNFPGANLLWQDGTTGTQIIIDTTGNYWVEVELGGCTGRDTIDAVFNTVPVVDLGPSQTVCEGDTVFLDAGNTGATYLWQNGTSSQVLAATVNGNYTVTVSLGNCSANDQVLITFDPVPFVAFGSDTTLCKGFPIFLDATNAGATYIWQDGTIDPFIFAEDPGTYSVIISIGNCTASDTIILDQQDKPSVILGEDSVLCAGQPLVLSAFNYGATYSWQDGSTDSLFKPEITGLYYATAINQCGISADSIFLTFNICNCLVYIPNAFTPNRDNKNEIFNYQANCTDFKGKLEIYNRFGQLLFKSEDPLLGWDGTFEGKDATEAAYVYVLTYSGYDNGRFREEKIRDTFLLFR